MHGGRRRNRSTNEVPDFARRCNRFTSSPTVTDPEPLAFETGFQSCPEESSRSGHPAAVFTRPAPPEPDQPRLARRQDPQGDAPCLGFFDPGSRASQLVSLLDSPQDLLQSALAGELGDPIPACRRRRSPGCPRGSRRRGQRSAARKKAPRRVLTGRGAPGYSAGRRRAASATRALRHWLR